MLKWEACVKNVFSILINICCHEDKHVRDYSSCKMSWYYLKEWLANYSYSDIFIWQLFSWKLMKWAFYFKENYRWQYLFPKTELSSKNENFWKLVSALSLRACLYLKFILMRLVVTINVIFFKTLQYDICQYLEYLDILVNKYFSSDHCMLL